MTMTVNEAEPVLPALSFAVQVTVVCPSANVEPDGGLQVAGTFPSMSSFADAE